MYPNKRIIGQCSICGGNVVVPTVCWSVNPPVPICESCGAVKRNELPVIPMVPGKQRKWTNKWSESRIDWRNACDDHNMLCECHWCK